MQMIDVLIVEDNLIDQKILSSFLEEYDISYQIAKDGHEAKSHLKTTAFRLIFLDLGLPEMDGYQIADFIRLDLKIDTPIVAVTAYTIDEVKDKCFTKGMNACFSKPIGKVVVVGILTQFLPEDKLNSTGDS